MTRSAASSAGKGRKTGLSGRKGILAPAPAGAKRRPPPKKNGRTEARVEVRRLRQELARARAEIEQLKATAETDFLLGILNRRGFRCVRRSRNLLRPQHV